jgi:hypothetical protein
MTLEMEFEFERNLQVVVLTIMDFRKLVVLSVREQTNCDLGCRVV